MTADDVQIAGPNRPRTVHKLTFSHRERLGTDHACRARPAQNTNHKDQNPLAAAQDSDQDNHQRQVWDDKQNVGQTHEGVFDTATVKTGHQANRAANDQRNKRGEKADDQRDACAVDQVGQHILAHIIRTQPMLRTRRCKNIFACHTHGRLGIKWGNPGCQQGD